MNTSPSVCICTLPGYCSLLKTGPTAGKPVTIFRAQNKILHTEPFSVSSQGRDISVSYIKADTFVFKDDVMSPTAGSYITPSLPHASLAMCCEAQSVRQILDQYSFRCVKECSG